MNPPRAVAASAAATGAAHAVAKQGIIRLVNRVRVELIDALDRELAKFDITAAQLIVLKLESMGLVR